MPLDTASAVAVSRGVTKKFRREAKSTSTFYQRIASIEPSNGADENYGMLGSMPVVREYVGERVIHQLRASEYVLKNKEWEVSLGIKKTDISDDRLSLYDSPLRMLAQRAVRHQDKLAFEALQNGESTACFDGQFFFDTDHSWGDSGAQSNDLTKTVSSTSAVTEAEFLDSYEAARSQMFSITDDRGEPIHDDVITGIDSGASFIALVPRQLEVVAKKAFNKNLTGGGDSNVVLDRPEVVMSTYLTSSVKWYLIRTDVPLLPLVFQAREPLDIGSEGEDSMKAKTIDYMTYARYNVGYGAWWNAMLTTLST